MRINKMLPLYLLEADGTAISKETGEVIEPINRTEYRLETAEKLFLEIKNKTINLVRRFTREQLIKLYKDGDEYKGVSEKPEKTPCPKKVDTVNEPLNEDFVTKVDKVDKILPPIDNKSGQDLNSDGGQTGVYINGERYDTLRQASEILSINRTTIDKRIKSDNFPTYYRIE